jgi:hypothetical protein
VAPLLIKVILAPGLMVAASLATRRGGPRLGGVVASFPAIVGPVVLVTALEHGTRTAAHTADGTLVGLASWAGFAIAYARVARHGWVPALVAGWLAAAALGTAAGVLAGGHAPIIDALTGLTSLLAARMLLSRCADGPPGQVAQPNGKPTTILFRAVVTAGLVTALASAVSVFGAAIGGVLAALPVLASLLTVFTHRQAGPRDAVELLRGMVLGMLAFAAFCEVAALTLVNYGTAPGLALATLAACVLQALFVLRRSGYPPARKSAGRSDDASSSAAFSPSASRSAA